MGYFADQWQKAAGTPMTVAFGVAATYTVSGGAAASVTIAVSREPRKYESSAAQTADVGEVKLIFPPAAVSGGPVKGALVGIDGESYTVTEVRKTAAGRYEVRARRVLASVKRATREVMP